MKSSNEHVLFHFNYCNGTDQSFLEADGVKEMAQRVNKYTLYRNAGQLIKGDLEIAQIITSDGSGAGAWPGMLERRDANGIYDPYFDLVDSIIFRLVELHSREN